MSAKQPFVTVICTCYNHADYVKEALASVMAQTYSSIQLIVIDNFSTDFSVAVIIDFIAPYPDIVFIQNKENKGICRAFNDAVALAKGEYLIDLAADDVFCPDRIEKQVEEFERLAKEYAVLYTNIALINAQGQLIKYHFKPDESPPTGDIFARLLEKHFLPSPSTMFRKSAFLSLGGYNEALAFEDFNYWIRCARQYSFCYLDIVSTKKRVLPHSLSTKFYDAQSSVMLESTFSTFQWASIQLKNGDEEKALEQGASYYFRQSVLLGHFVIAQKFYSLLGSPKHLTLPTILCMGLFRVKWKVVWFYKQYLKMKGF